jgi:hypothetical protein
MVQAPNERAALDIVGAAPPGELFGQPSLCAHVSG